MNYWIACSLLLVSAAECGGPRPDLAGIERRTFQAINEERRKRGLSELSWSEELAKQARLHSRSMAERGFFSHRDPVRGELADRLDQAGVRFRACAENIFKEQGYSDPSEQAVQRWLLSPGHRRNLLNGMYTQSAVGVAAAGDRTLYFTQIFVTPAR